MRLKLAALLLALAPRAAAQDAEPTLEDAQAAEGAALYLEHCARCHGPQGFGDGPENEGLERPARSFAAGGFSFGDTPEALSRTVAKGIPGSPMAAFEDALSEEQITRVVEHLATLMPERRVVEVDEAELRIEAHPVIARGHLGAVLPGGPAFPRALVLGLQGGERHPDLSLVYDAADLRLLQIRQGAFLRRTDWTGRGGTPLELLGEILWTAKGGDPGAEWFLLEGETRTPLRARLRQVTEVSKAGARNLARQLELHAELVAADGTVHGSYVEQIGLVAPSTDVQLSRSLRVLRQPQATLVRGLSLGEGQQLAHTQGRAIGLRGGPCHPQRTQGLLAITRDAALQGMTLSVSTAGTAGLLHELVEGDFPDPLEIVFPPNEPLCDRDEELALSILNSFGLRTDRNIAASRAAFEAAGRMLEKR